MASFGGFPSHPKVQFTYLYGEEKVEHTSLIITLMCFSWQLYAQWGCWD